MVITYNIVLFYLDGYTKIFRGVINILKITKIKKLALVMSLISVISVGCAVKNNSNKGERNDKDLVQEEIVNIEEDLVDSVIEQPQYTDGEYTGEYKAIGVKVTIKDGKIFNIDITKNKQTPGYYEAVFMKLPKEIIEKQTIVVDGVTGSTSTSTNLKEAVSDALEKAKINE